MLDPILSEAYSTVLPAAPYVIAAYAGIWLVLVVFGIALWRTQRRTRDDIEALKEALRHREDDAQDGHSA